MISAFLHICSTIPIAILSVLYDCFAERLITIPSPNVTNNHQEKNAIYYENKKMLEVINERELQDPYQFLFVIENMYKDRYKYVNNIEKYFIKNSKELFINEVYKVINNG